MLLSLLENHNNQDVLFFDQSWWPEFFSFAVVALSVDVGYKGHQI
jgi:hypothetical protein